MTTPNTDVTVELSHVSKSFGDKLVVDDFSVHIDEGEFFSILGPSGCGKTTTLRMLAGFLVPNSGTIALGGEDVSTVPPYRRDVNTVFQSYALFNHLNVGGNVAFGLRRKKVPKPEIRRRVMEALELVALADRADSKPAQLSGGQRQRVALARALVNMPKLLLLDEPLGALDLQLRRQMQLELKRIQRDVGITFVYVTHDQEEALTMSDRIAVMDAGRLQQVGGPRQVYDQPANAFVARFIGTSNLLDVERADGDLRLTDGTVVGSAAESDAGETTLSIRPEKLRVSDAPPSNVPRLNGTIVDISYLGVTTHLQVRTGSGSQLTVVEANTSGEHRPEVTVGDRVTVWWQPRDALMLPGAAP